MADWFLPLLAAPFVGSVLGVLVRRLPHGLAVGLSRSACEACGRTLSAAELVPLLSYVVLRGRCRGCSGPIGRFHPAIELAATFVAGVVLLARIGQPEIAWADCLLGWVLLTLAWIDWEHRRLLDVLTLPLVLLGLGATWWLDPAGLLDHAIGAVAGYAAFRLVALGYHAWRGREGLGQGDAKLLAAAGAWVGWEGLDQVVLIGALAALAMALGQRSTQGLSGGTAVPFGPGLALGIFAVRLMGYG